MKRVFPLALVLAVLLTACSETQPGSSVSASAPTKVAHGYTNGLQVKTTLFSHINTYWTGAGRAILGIRDDLLVEQKTRIHAVCSGLV